MTGTHYSKRTYLSIGVLLLGILTLIAIVAAAVRKQSRSLDQTAVGEPNQNATPAALSKIGRVSKSEFSRYLPDGAVIGNENRDIVFADLDGNGQQEQIIFYSLYPQPKDGIMVLKRKGKEYAKLWETSYDDSSSFYDLSGVSDLNKNGRPQIVSYRSIGSSCPGVLEIYESRNGKIERITGAWVEQDKLCGSIEIKDLDGDGRSEIIHGQGHGMNPDVYRWNGKQYVKSNREFSQYYDDGLAQLIRDVYSGKELPTYVRVRSCKQAVEIYLLQHRYAEAITLCNGVLRIIDDPKLTKPNSIIGENETTEQRNRIMATYEVEKTQGKATVHRLLGDSYKAASNSPQAQEHYAEAKKLEDLAKDLRSRLP